ncbi:MAG: ATP-binding protein [Kofleriaceae bacterium]
MSSAEARYDRLAVLAEVAHAFASVATDYRSLLAKIARTMSELIGDGCLVTLVEGNTIVNAASAHRIPALETTYAEFLEQLPEVYLDQRTMAGEVIKANEPKLVAEVEPGAIAANVDPMLRPLARKLDVRSLAIAPIRARGTVIGALSLFRTGSGRSYNPNDLLLLSDLADRAGLAIENARMYASLEERVRERTQALEAANRELEAFSYSVAHDLRAPLRSIDGFAHALLDDYAGVLDANGQRFLDRIRVSAQNMGVLIDGLLALAQVGRHEMHRQRVSLSDPAAQVVARLREEEPERDVTVTIDPDLFANADPRLVETILQNLIGNAWKFTSKTAHATIHVGAIPDAFFVRDNGAGFDPQFAEKLFTAFTRLHSSADFAGTGIGLGTVQRAVTRHGGRVWADSTVGHGATFFFTLG